MIFYRAVKKIVDLLIASMLIVVLLPVYIVLFLLTLLFQGPPVLFRQTRPGLNGKPFTLIKFRTMRKAGKEKVHPESDAERLTSFGRWLRRTSLDELPELWNVLRGDMSLVGPRPLLMQYLDRYTAQQARRHEVKPGITGWAQVNGRNAVSWEERFKMDVWYVDHVSFWLDLRILLLTIVKVFKREGISGEGSITMPEFMGYLKKHNH